MRRDAEEAEERRERGENGDKETEEDARRRTRGPAHRGKRSQETGSRDGRRTPVRPGRTTATVPAGMDARNAELRLDLAALRRWAGRTPAVVRLWVYRPRLAGAGVLGIAVELSPRPGDADARTAWLGEADHWRLDLRALLQSSFRLEHYTGADPELESALRAGSELVYER